MPEQTVAKPVRALRVMLVDDRAQIPTRQSLASESAAGP
jgi:hypothetical protein